MLQIVGFKNSGKTTLIGKLIQKYKQQNLKIGTIKHDAHDFKMDHKGTDTWVHRETGAAMTAITSPTQTALLMNGGCSLPKLIEQMSDMDVVLVEGFKEQDYPKLVLIREPADLKLLSLCTNILAILTWIPLEQDKLSIPIVSIDDELEIIFSKINLKEAEDHDSSSNHR